MKRRSAGHGRHARHYRGVGNLRVALLALGEPAIWGCVCVEVDANQERTRRAPGRRVDRNHMFQANIRRVLEASGLSSGPENIAFDVAGWSHETESLTGVTILFAITT